MSARPHGHSASVGICAEQILAALGKHITVDQDNVVIRMDRGAKFSTLEIELRSRTSSPAWNQQCPGTVSRRDSAIPLRSYVHLEMATPGAVSPARMSSHLHHQTVSRGKLLPAKVFRRGVGLHHLKSDPIRRNMNARPAAGTAGRDLPAAPRPGRFSMTDLRALSAPAPVVTSPSRRERVGTIRATR